MILPKITDKQITLLYYFYMFRFLHTNQIQQLFHHKDKSTVKEWLKDLRVKGYIAKVVEEKSSFEQRTKPAVYCLAPNGRKFLLTQQNCDAAVLEKVYKEIKRKQRFIDKCLSIADIYLFFLSQKESHQELEFFTESELTRYPYFPQKLPSAYISITTDGETQRYFLEVFRPFTPAAELRSKVKQYIHYARSGDWEANITEEPLPAVLFVCPSYNVKSHIYFHTKAKFAKAFTEEFELYVTTWELIRKNPSNIWEKVTLE